MFLKNLYHITMQSKRQIKHIMIIYNINNKYSAVSSRPTRQAVIEMSQCLWSTSSWSIFWYSHRTKVAYSGSDKRANAVVVATGYHHSYGPGTLRPCSHCHSCAGTVPICRISRVCERAMSAIKLDLISEN